MMTDEEGEAAVAAAIQAAEAAMVANPQPDSNNAGDIVEIELPEGNAPEAGQPQAPVEQIDTSPHTGARQPNRTPARQRIQGLVGENRDLKRALAALEQERTQLQQQLASMSDQQLYVQKSAMDIRKAAIGTEREGLSSALRSAMQEQNVDEQVKITSRMTDLAAEEKQLDIASRNLELHVQARSAQAQQPQQPQNQGYQTEYDEQEDDIPNFAPDSRDNYQRWVSGKPQYDMRSDDFDPEYYAAAESVSAALSQRLIQQGQSDLVGSPGYFKAVDDALARKFPIYYQSQTQRAPVNFAAANRGMAQANITSTPPKRATVQLTRDESELVRGLWNSGAFDDRRTGKRPTLKEVAAKYVQSKGN